jgi:hypothetical protein
MGQDANIDEPSSEVFLQIYVKCMLPARGSKFHYLCKYMKTIPFLNEKIFQRTVVADSTLYNMKAMNLWFCCNGTHFSLPTYEL